MELGTASPEFPVWRGVEEKDDLKDQAQYFDQVPDGIIAGYLKNTLRIDSLHWNRRLKG